MVICAGSLLLALPASTPEIKGDKPKISPQNISTQLSAKQLREIGKSLTVKVRSQEVLGSGILIQKQGSIYAVLTNAHVLRTGDLPYKIETRDGKIYPAELVKTAKFDDNDLSLLQFSANANYAIAKLGIIPKPGEEVFAAGFPFSAEGSGERGFVFRTGKVWLMLDKALVGGYQIGYTNDIEKGMSGGPLLNSRGELVAVNGMNAYPLWGDPYIFKDGSQPILSVRKEMINYSWGIPIANVKHLVFKK
ncbi:S1 family peptidase [Aerosakkonema funiforme]|uniref:S1 family peptidase n=1 Tax=Aerosakkonema funiforme TaxID=1246630 RepID=UPI0035BC293B